MPHGRRTREVIMSSAKKQTKEDKLNRVEQIRSNINNYKDIYVLYYKNESTPALNALREMTKDSKFSFASNAALQFAVGRDEQTELAPKTHLLSKLIRGKCALLFTNLNGEEVKQTLA